MVPPCSDRISRVPPYSNGSSCYQYGAVTRFGPTFQMVPVVSEHGLVRVRSPLLAESRLISFPPATEMFHFAGFAPLRVPSTGGFPHSDICGSKSVRDSPQLFAAYHVLHRLSMPRHPPNALKALDHSHYRCPRTSRRPDYDMRKDQCSRVLPGIPARSSAGRSRLQRRYYAPMPPGQTFSSRFRHDNSAASARTRRKPSSS